MKISTSIKGSASKLLYCITVFMAMFCYLGSMAQTTVTLGGEGSITCPATPTATWAASPVGVSFSNLTRGAGVACASANDGLSGSGFNTASAAASFTGNKFFTVTITADATHFFTLTSFTWLTALSGSASGTLFTLQYQNNGGALTTFGTAAQNGTASNTFTGSVTVAAGTSIVLYATPSNTSSLGGTVRFKNGSTFVLTASTFSAPTVTTTTAAGATPTSINAGGNVTSDGGATVSARGVAYGTAPNPLAGILATSDGTGTGIFNSLLSPLSVNTQYFYRAYATNTLGTSYGSESSFYTLATAPGTVTVNNATTTSEDVTLGVDANPATTQYAIQEAITGNYVQADGSLAASAVWQTSAVWATITVTGLGVNTNATFQAKARNAANIETAFGGSASLYTLANTPAAPVVDGATSVSLDVTITVNGNPAATEFAIQETTGGNYVQADGSLAATAIWQTATVWGTKTVNGLAASTVYTFQVKARNGNAVESPFGPSQNGTTLAANAPVLTQTTLSPFGAVCINTTTAANTFTITGTSLNNTAVTVSALAGYTFSTDDVMYTTSLSIAQAGGSFSQLVYVKFTPTAAISYDGNIAVGGGGAATDNVAASGSGINTAATVATNTASNITISSATVLGTITTLGCSGITAYGAEYSTINNFANGTGITAAGVDLSAGTFTVALTLLNSGTTYYYHTYATNNGGTAYSTQGSFTTATPVLTTGALTAFGPVCTNTTSAANTFTITGTNLSTANVTVASLNGYTYSTDDITYTASLSIAQPGGTFSQLVYVKFSPTLVQSYNGNIVIAGGDAANSTVAAAGSGINTTPSVTTGTASAVTQISATLNGSITANGCTAVSAYGIEYSTVNGFANGTGTPVAGGTLNVGAYSSAVSGLNAGALYYYKAYATNGAGTTYGAQQSFTTLALEPPVATAATLEVNDGFTANWDAVSGATSYSLDVSTSPTFGTSITASDLFISQYVEGSATNKYLEIYNGTGATVSLSDYKLRLYSNGGTTPVDLTLSGTLTNGTTIVYKNSAATLYAGAATVANTVINFNGDDAVVLFKISTNTAVDIFGRIGEDPGAGWVGGGNSTVDKTLTRKASVTGGVTVNPASGFPTLAAEWTQSNIDVVTDLGSHTFTAFTPLFVPGYENLSVNGLSQSVTGLTAGTTYYYRVRAVSASSTSANSNTITATTTVPCVATVTATAGANGIISPAGATDYTCGDDAVYSISANTCYSIADVSVDGISQGAISSYTFTGISEGSHTISATFILNSYSITVTAGAGGSISPGSGTVACGSNQQYFITADACNTLTSVVVDGVSVGALSEFTFTNVTGPHTISATFTATTYSITAGAGPNGSVTPAGTSAVNCGSNAVYTITPDACYHVLDVLVDGISVGPVTTYSFTNVAAAHTISATFEINSALTISVSGPVNICPYVGTGDQIVYTATAPGATGFTWITPPNVTVVSGAGTASLTVTFQNGFTTQNNKQIRVTALSSCGNSPLFIYYLVAQAPNTPSPIIASGTNVCSIINTASTITYTIPSVLGATSYVWSNPAGTTITHPNGPGINDTTITLSFNNTFITGNLTVAAANDGCGTSNARSISIIRANPSTPGLISGPTNACAYTAPGGIAAVYSVVPVPGASSYTWSVPAGATGLTGQGTTAISFTYPSTFTSGSITVTATNGCGTSNLRSLSISRLTPAAPGMIDVIQTASCPDRIYTYTISTMPTNATSVQWTIPSGAVLVSGQGSTSITVSYPPASLAGTISAQSINNCAVSSIRSSEVRLPACAPERQVIAKGTIPVVTPATGMEVQVAPNPTTSLSRLQVITSASEIIHVRVLDMQGRAFKQVTVMPNQTIMIGSDLKAGTYLIEVRQGNRVKTTKLIKF